MRDFTQGSIPLHIVSMAAPVTISMFVQAAYHLVDLYFVTRIGTAATAGVNAAGVSLLIVQALSLILTVGTVALVAHAVGRRDRVDANAIFNQSLALSIACATAVMLLLYSCARPYMQTIARDADTIQAGVDFMMWVAPGFVLMFPMAVVSSALRSTGEVRAPVVAYTTTVVVNVVLAPILIAGWGTAMPMGVKGAGLATSVGVAVGMILLTIRFRRLQPYMAVQPRLMRPNSALWRRILRVGIPSGAEYAVMFLVTAVVYQVIRDLGASAQAGFGIGSRVLQLVLVPAMAIASATVPIAGQNLGSHCLERVRETFWKAVIVGAVLMLLASIPAHWQPAKLVSAFAADPADMDVAEKFLQLLTWTLVPQSLIYTCSAMFQGLGNTVPALISSFVRLSTFSIPALWLSSQSVLSIEQVSYLWIASVVLQAITSAWLLHLELARQQFRSASTLSSTT